MSEGEKKEPRFRAEFICTGMCCADHPKFDHCKECHHSEFKTVAPYAGGKVEVWLNRLHGPMFYREGKAFYPGPHSKLWKIVLRLGEFSIRSLSRWKGKS